MASDPRLAKLLEVPLVGDQHVDPRWDAVEAAIGLNLPGNYKALVDLYGASVWREFLHVLSPFAKRRGLQQVAAEILDADRSVRGSFPDKFVLPIYPEPGGTFPWAVTDNGDTLYFITKGNPDDWPTMIRDARAPDFEVLFLAPALLIRHFSIGGLQSAILPRMADGKT